MALTVGDLAVHEPLHRHLLRSRERFFYAESPVTLSRHSPTRGIRRSSGGVLRCGHRHRGGHQPRRWLPAREGRDGGCAAGRPDEQRSATGAWGQGQGWHLPPACRQRATQVGGVMARRTQQHPGCLTRRQWSLGSARCASSSSSILTATTFSGSSCSTTCWSTRPTCMGAPRAPPRCATTRVEVRVRRRAGARPLPVRQAWFGLRDDGLGPSATARPTEAAASWTRYAAGISRPLRSRASWIAASFGELETSEISRYVNTELDRWGGQFAEYRGSGRSQ